MFSGGQLARLIRETTMETNDAVIAHAPVGLLDNIDQRWPLRLRLGQFLENARDAGHRVAERYAEALFWTHVVGPANKQREVYAQIMKTDDYDQVSEMVATEDFCEMVHEEVSQYDRLPLIKPELANNSVRTINQIWNARQIADLYRLHYPEFVPELIRYVAARTRRKRRIEAVDLPRYAEAVAKKMTRFRA